MIGRCSGQAATDRTETAGIITPTATSWNSQLDKARLTLGKRVKICKMEASNGC